MIQKHQIKKNRDIKIFPNIKNNTNLKNKENHYFVDIMNKRLSNINAFIKNL